MVSKTRRAVASHAHPRPSLLPPVPISGGAAPSTRPAASTGLQDATVPRPLDAPFRAILSSEKPSASPPAGSRLEVPHQPFAGHLSPRPGASLLYTSPSTSSPDVLDASVTSFRTSSLNYDDSAASNEIHRLHVEHAAARMRNAELRQKRDQLHSELLAVRDNLSETRFTVRQLSAERDEAVRVAQQREADIESTEYEFASRMQAFAVGTAGLLFARIRFPVRHDIGITRHENAWESGS